MITSISSICFIIVFICCSASYILLIFIVSFSVSVSSSLSSCNFISIFIPNLKFSLNFLTMFFIVLLTSLICSLILSDFFHSFSPSSNLELICSVKILISLSNSAVFFSLAFFLSSLVLVISSHSS